MEARTDLGGGGSISGIRNPSPTKGSPFGIVLWHPISATNPETVLKMPSVPVYFNFEGEREPKKRNFLIKILKRRVFSAMY